MEITVVTAGTREYAGCIKKTAQNAEKFGYSSIVYDLGGLGIGETYKVDFPTKGQGRYIPKSPYKPDMIALAIETPTVYLDGDAVLLRPLDFEWDFDIGVTVRDPAKEKHDFPHITGYLNAGVVFVNFTFPALTFLRRWSKEIPKTLSGSDQEALTNLVKSPPPEVRVREFLCDKYNQIYPSKTECVIRHFKGGQPRVF